LVYLDGRTVVYTNKSLLHALQRTEEDILGRDILDILPGDVTKEAGIFLSRVEGSEGKVLSGTIKSKNPLDPELNYDIVGESSGGSTIVSISASKPVGGESDERFIELQDRLAAFLALTAKAGIGVGVFELLPDGELVVRSLNDHAYSFFGRTPAEMVNRNPLEFLHPDDLEPMRGTLRRLAETGSVEPVEARIIDPDGETVHLRISHSMLTTQEGSLGIGFIQDITAERDALEMQNKMVRAIERVNETVVLADEMANIIYANPAALRNSGYTFEEVIGQPASIFHAPESLESIGFQALEELVTKGFFRNDLMACTKDGHRYPVEVSASAVKDEKGDISMIVVVSRKIEERQRFEAKLLMERARSKLIHEKVMHHIIPAYDDLVRELDVIMERIRCDEESMEALDGVINHLREIHEEATSSLDKIDDERTFEELKPIKLAEMLENDLPRILDRFRAKGTDIDIELRVLDDSVEVMVNSMFTELLLRVVRILLDISDRRHTELVLEINSVPLNVHPDYTMEMECGPEDLCFAELAFSGPGIKMDEDLKKVLTRRVMPTMGALGPELALAIDTARLLVFFFKGQFFIDEGDPEAPEQTSRLVVILPIAGTSPPAQQEPYFNPLDGDY
jgi:PAS domain S-box-containing protein